MAKKAPLTGGKSRFGRQIDEQPPKQTKGLIKVKKVRRGLSESGASTDQQGTRGTSSLPLERRKNLERGGKLKKQTKNKYPRAGSSW